MVVNPVRARPAPKKLVHAHGCRRCRLRYEDACSDPATNALCFTCRTGKPGFKELIEGRAPRDCCRAYTRLARKDEAKKYVLEGNLPWFICSICKRTFVIDYLER